MRSLAASHPSEKKEPGNQVATTTVLYFIQGDSEVKPLLHWPPVISQLLLEVSKKKGVCRLFVLGPSHSLQQALGPSTHSEDVCQSTR